MSMSNVQQKKVRAVSARPPVLRPKSGKNRRMHQKTQFIENVYGSNVQNFKKSKFTSMRYNLHDSEIEDVTRLLPRGDKIPKEREELFQQNLQLKRQINRLKDQLLKTKGKIDVLASKNQKYTKQLNMEFEKKMYWTGHNSYLISGIKAQYDKLKAEYEQKELECETLRRELVETQAPQFKVYAETLQQQNKKLVERISKMSQLSQEILFDNETNNRIPEYAFTDMEEKKEKLSVKLREREYEITILKEEKREQRKKVQFLQKLIIEKDNGQYHALKKAKKLERQNQTLSDQIRDLKTEIQERTRTYEVKLQRLKMTEDQKYRSEKDIFDRSLFEKEQKIAKLEKQVAYLSTLLTYWKPLDEINREVGDKVFDDDQSENINLTHHLNPDQETTSLKKSVRVRKPSEQISQKNDFILKNSTQMIGSVKEGLKVQNKVRVQQTADERHSEQAEKKRRVQHHEIQHLGEHLKFRFLGLNLPLGEVKTYFNNIPKNQFILSENEGEKQPTWEDEYVTMNQVKSTLMSYPFQLKQSEAHLLSRYLIQDSTNEYVYCDLKNQHKRSVVKSIIKAVVGDYEILEENRQKEIDEECKSMLDKYQTNLLSALSTMASSGVISRRKFLELLSSLGIELSEQGKDYLVCKMLLKSQSLQRLQYMVIL